MQTVVGIFVSIVLLIVVTWIAIFGGIGAVLARSRGSSGPVGFAWGAGLGPIGWLAILWTTRTGGISVPKLPLPPHAARPPSGSALPPDRPSTGSATPDRWDPWNK